MRGNGHKLEYKTLKLDRKENYSPLEGSDFGTEVQRDVNSSSEIHRIHSPTANGPENLIVIGPASRGVLYWITSKGHLQPTGFKVQGQEIKKQKYLSHLVSHLYQVTIFCTVRAWCIIRHC